MHNQNLSHTWYATYGVPYMATMHGTSYAIYWYVRCAIFNISYIIPPHTVYHILYDTVCSVPFEVIMYYTWYIIYGKLKLATIYAISWKQTQIIYIYIYIYENMYMCISRGWMISWKITRARPWQSRCQQQQQQCMYSAPPPSPKIVFDRTIVFSQTGEHAQWSCLIGRGPICSDHL